MAAQIYEFNVEMACDGCSSAVEKVLNNKAGIENVKVDLTNQKVLVTTTLTSEEILNYIKKTGKTCSFIGLRK